ncbi:MAG: hypothetical protein WBF88_12185 [Pusillimonas sp.]
MSPRLAEGRSSGADARARSRLAAVQGGQALAEGLVVMLVLVSLWVAVAWLGQLQDMALSAQHASGHAAFAFTRNPVGDAAEHIRWQYFQGPAHQWKDRGGNPMLALPLSQVQVNWARPEELDQEAQPGGSSIHAESLRRSWQLGDRGIVSARVSATPRHGVAASSAGSSVDFNRYPNLRRHTAILEGAGHAADDVRVQQIVAQSELAWSDSARASRIIGTKIDAAMAAVDAPWHRDRPEFDWLGLWAGHVPAERLADSPKGRP